MTVNELRDAMREIPGYLPVTISIICPGENGGLDVLHMPVSTATFENIYSFGGSLVIEPTGALSEALEVEQ